jgi:2-dehydro-3-deoxygluconokinase
MEYVTDCIANEEDAKDDFGIHASKNYITTGRIDQEGYVQVARELAERFALHRVAVTLRGSLSASENTWSGLLYAGGHAHFAPTYTISIVDRVGGGDSFGAGLIYALLTGKSDADAIRFAVAASALKHSIEHDFNLVSAAEVEALVAGDGSGRVRR